MSASRPNSATATAIKPRSAKRKGTAAPSADPFAGCNPQPVCIRWLSPDDEERADSAQVIRLLMDAGRTDYWWPNLTYQRSVLRQVAEFIGPARAVLFTPGGMVTAEVGPLADDMESLRHALDELTATLNVLDLGASPPETLLGVDGCHPGVATPVQTVLHLNGSGTAAAAADASVKLYPAGGEAKSLAGWRIVRATGGVPDDLSQARCVQTATGPVLVLVCHDACLLSGRSQSRATDPLRLMIRDHFRQVAQATGAKRPAFTLLATHWWAASARSGTIFKDAARRIADQTGSTVVTTTCAPRESLDDVARWSRTRGERAGEVVTLVVEDTWG